MKCPCGKKVKLEMKYGVRIYTHDDGTYCDDLNDFDVEMDDVIYKYSKQFPDATYVVCTKQRIKQYNKLANITNKNELKKELVKMNDDGKLFMNEMREVFGRTFTHNIDMIFVDKYSIKGIEGGQNTLDIIEKTKKNKLPKLKMIKLDKSPTKVSDVMEQLRRKVNGVKNKLDQYSTWGQGLN